MPRVRKLKRMAPLVPKREPATEVAFAFVDLAPTPSPRQLPDGTRAYVVGGDPADGR